MHQLVENRGTLLGLTCLVGRFGCFGGLNRNRCHGRCPVLKQFFGNILINLNILQQIDWKPMLSQLNETDS